MTENTKCFAPSVNGTEDAGDETGRMTLEELQESSPEVKNLQYNTQITIYFNLMHIIEICIIIN